MTAAVTGLGPVSRLGIGAAQLARTDGAPDPAGTAGPLRVAELDNFDPAEFLGRRGWKFLPPVTRVTSVAARLALADAGLDPASRLADTGIVVGTNFAVTDITDRIDRALLAEGIPGISPVECPNFAVNVPASQVAIVHGLTAFSLTLVNLLTAGCEALLVGAQALRSGRAGGVLAGAIEGRPPAAAAGVTGADVDAAAACLLYLEPAETAAARGAGTYAVLTGGLRRTLPAEPVRAAAALTTALDRTVAGAGQLHLFVPAGERGFAAARAAADWGSGPGTGAAVSVTRGAAQSTATSVLQLARLLARNRAVGTASPDLVLGVLGPMGQLVLVRFALPAPPTAPTEN